MALTTEQLRRLRRIQTTGNRIKAAREMLTLTQVQLASAIGITQSSLSDIERTRYMGVTLETARKFSDYFGCSIEDLFPAKVEVA